MHHLPCAIKALDNVDLSTLDATARNEAIGRCKDIIFALQTPERHTMDISLNLVEAVGIRTMMRLGVLQALPAPTEEGISIEDLAQKTQAPASLLARFLRVLVGTRFIRQDSNLKYSHTTTSQTYLDLPGYWFLNTYDAVMPDLWPYPIKYIDAHPDQPEPVSTSVNPFTFRMGREGTDMWEVYAETQPPERMADFQKAMSMVTVGLPAAGAYDYDKLLVDDDGKRPLVVDVGGGAGQCMAKILLQNPSISPSRCYLEDIPLSLQHARNNPDLPKDLNFVETDFFKSQPVPGAKAYFMRWILHDYSDENSLKILNTLKGAMREDSVLLINDHVLPERVDEGSVHAAMMDIWMMEGGGRERTRRDFERLLGEVGMRIKKIWMIPGTTQGTIEAVLA